MTYRPADFRFTEEGMDALIWAADFAELWEAWERSLGWLIYDQDEEA